MKLLKLKPRVLKKDVKNLEHSSQEVWNNAKPSNISVIRIPKGEGKEKGAEVLEEVLQNHKKDTKIQIEEAQKTLGRISFALFFLRYLTHCGQTEEKKLKVLKLVREKWHIPYKNYSNLI